MGLELIQVKAGELSPNDTVHFWNEPNHEEEYL
jgi:hypothetical protein